MELMFDIETLDVCPSSVVLSIGAVTFDPVGRIWDRYYRVLDIDEQTKQGRTISQSTLFWWLQQEPQALDEAFSEDRYGVPYVLQEFKEFGVGRSIEAYWCLGPHFDGTIWESLCRDFGTTPPWGYSQLRDVRTLCMETGVDYHRHATQVRGVAHNPMYDCEVQVETLTLARGRIKTKSS